MHLLMRRTSVSQHTPSMLEIDDARMFPHSFGRILVGQGVCTVVGIVLQPCDTMDGKGRGTLDFPLS